MLRLYLAPDLPSGFQIREEHILFQNQSTRDNCADHAVLEIVAGDFRIITNCDRNWFLVKPGSGKKDPVADFFRNTPESGSLWQRKANQFLWHRSGTAYLFTETRIVIPDYYRISGRSVYFRSGSQHYVLHGMDSEAEAYRLSWPKSAGNPEVQSVLRQDDFLILSYTTTDQRNQLAIMRASTQEWVLLPAGVLREREAAALRRENDNLVIRCEAGAEESERYYCALEVDGTAVDQTGFCLPGTDCSLVGRLESGRHRISISRFVAGPDGEYRRDNNIRQPDPVSIVVRQNDCWVIELVADTKKAYRLQVWPVSNEL